ncbi:hypothetical protein COCCADRAFT_34701 [Bipolaris zeicola 26-R-13]|uniref:Uncharacterized protein n=1 Tax=Cochliobolus carbonum (strain 26-R-13) TaxID=930089 RepID=W6YJU5_COCC2|nr:uncharacterized protein COCCADRAFT_34701 [Bipolaris zeicola 26-R-13]EUC35844.1 hypothetical protein COCCADRAFT_34701 [Bipolaris zeicola 26-R-13]
MTQALPPVRACIFDVDGTLINSEDIYTSIYNHILREYGRPEYPWAIKATQQSRGSRGTNRLLAWAQVPLSPAEWALKEKAHTHLFRNSETLAGIDDLLQKLKFQTTPPILLSLASSAGREKFALKTSHLACIGRAFQDSALQVFGDDLEMSDSKKKPEPDIFLLALRRLNAANTARGERALDPRECLVFEDSIAGVEAARRAGMRVVWVPHPGLARVCKGREMDVLMGRTEADDQVPDYATPVQGEARGPVVGEDGRLMSEDGVVEMRHSLENFPYRAYGIDVVE